MHDGEPAALIHDAENVRGAATLASTGEAVPTERKAGGALEVKLGARRARAAADAVVFRDE